MTNNEHEDDGSSISPPMFRTVPIAHMHRFYLSGEIGDPEKYIPMFEQIRTAEENDVVMLFINSPGGSLATTLQFLRVLEETPATTVAIVEGYCMSAATLIFLSCKHKQISRFSQFMFHNYSTLWAGKGNQIHVGMNHMHQEWARVMKMLYTPVLTPEEIQSILEDRDVWLNDEAMKARLEALEKAIEEKNNAPTTPTTPVVVESVKKTTTAKKNATTKRRAVK
jgi:ATP-dependent Clp protease protease subunit